MKRNLYILTWRTAKSNSDKTSLGIRKHFSLRLQTKTINSVVQQSSHISTYIPGFLSTKEATERRNHLFSLEKKRQLENVGRIEKIEVNYKGVPKDCTLIMNKDISTPYDCARRKCLTLPKSPLWCKGLSPNSEKILAIVHHRGRLAIDKICKKSGLPYCLSYHDNHKRSLTSLTFTMLPTNVNECFVSVLMMSMCKYSILTYVFILFKSDSTSMVWTLLNLSSH